MESHVIQPKSLLETLAPEWPDALLDEIRSEIVRGGRKVIILDDDPTGTQTAKDIPVLTEWTVEAFTEELGEDGPGFFVLTNSRSLPERAACQLNGEIGKNLRKAAMMADMEITVISRSDSTLRGHYPAEVKSLAMSLQIEQLPHLLIPFFLEGGRYTIEDIHYVADEDKLIPAAQTPFATDAAFGFSHSDLKLWVEEKSRGRVSVEDVCVVSLDDIRRGGPDVVTTRLCSVPEYGVCVVNAASYRDMEVVVAALLRAEQQGNGFLARTAASFVRTRLGLPVSEEPVGRSALITAGSQGGLFIVGSYVEKTGRQVDELLQQGDSKGIELDVVRLMHPDTRKSEIEAVTSRMNAALNSGKTTVVYTSRVLQRGKDVESSLQIGAIVSESLVSVVRGIQRQPRYLVAKGGITSSDVATRGLGVKRAMVLGQVQAGVPVWRLGKESRFQNMAYIVYPGNVGNVDSLADISRMLSG